MAPSPSISKQTLSKQNLKYSKKGSLQNTGGDKKCIAFSRPILKDQLTRHPQNRIIYKKVKVLVESH